MPRRLTRDGGPVAVAHYPIPSPPPPGRVPRAASSPVSTSGAGPSRFYRQHHQVEAPRVDARVFRQAWVVRTRLDKLFAEGAIEARTWRAAIAYRDLRNLAEAGLLGAIRIDGTGRVQTYRGSRLERSEAQLDAIEQLRRIERQLAQVACSLIEQLVIDDRSWAAIGKRLNINPKTAKCWCVTALQRLAEIGV